MSAGTKIRKTVATQVTNLTKNTPAYHTLKRVDALEEFPGADDILLVADEPGEFHFHGLQECGVTTFFLLSRITKNGADENIFRPRSEGRVYFRDIPAGTPRARRVLPGKQGNIKVTLAPPTVDAPPATHVLKSTCKATRKARGATFASAAPVVVTEKRGRGRPKGSTNKKKSA